MSDFWDDDIARLDLSASEKNGLQIFRNYQTAFDSHAEKAFAAQVDSEDFNGESLRRVLELITKEDPRLLPVISCSYADDILLGMYKAGMPAEVLGGTSALFGPYGPISNLSSRLQLAYLFRLLSPDLVKDLDRLRKVRNDLAHSWDVNAFQDFFANGHSAELSPVDALLAEHTEKIPEFATPLEPLRAFRVRLIWLMARLTYEGAYYWRAARQRLSPGKALFGSNCPSRLSVVSGLALKASKVVIAQSA